MLQSKEKELQTVLKKREPTIHAYKRPTLGKGHIN